jgi:hypothetical protein
MYPSLTNWSRFGQQVLTTGGLVGVLMVVGCSTLSRQIAQNPFQQRVCPACSARSVEDCRCFTPTENAGFCETNWYSSYAQSENSDSFNHAAKRTASMNRGRKFSQPVEISITDVPPNDVPSRLPPTTLLAGPLGDIAKKAPAPHRFRDQSNDPVQVAAYTVPILSGAKQSADQPPASDLQRRRLQTDAELNSIVDQHEAYFRQ